MYALSDQSQTILNKLSEKQYLQETRLILKNVFIKVVKLNVELRFKKNASQAARMCSLPALLFFFACKKRFFLMMRLKITIDL